MLRLSRRITGGAALGLYLWMGALIWITIIPGANGHRPPDFYLLGYQADQIAPFLTALTDEARATYAYLLQVTDPAFIVMFAAWIALMGWRTPIVRGVVVLLAATYGVIDLGENRAICELVCGEQPLPGAVERASALTMAKFASLFSALMGMLWAVLREREVAQGQGG